MNQNTSSSMTTTIPPTTSTNFNITTISHNNEQIIAQQLLNAYLIHDKYRDITNNDINIDHNGCTPILLASQLPSSPNQSILPIFKTLLKHGAKIDNIYELIQNASKNHHWSTIQYLIETYQEYITDESKFIQINLLHHATGTYNQPSLEFISFLLSLGIFDINGKNEQNKTPIQCAMNTKLDIDIIKLLIQNGATITIVD